jgi:protein involved in polysaccharide export with SLBB domain
MLCYTLKVMLKGSSKGWPGVFCLALFLSFAGCAQKTPVVAPPLELEPLPAFESPAYRLQPRDLVAIKFWSNPELNEEQRIRPDGNLSLPFLDEVPAAGLTPAELDKVLTARYSSELNRPDLTVIVREAALPQIFVGGEVGVQGVVPLTEGLTLFRAIQRAGGFKLTARRQDVMVVRLQADGKPVARKVDLLPILSGRDPSLDPLLAPNDIVFVPRTKVESARIFIQQYINEMIPLQNVFSGILLGTLASDSTEDPPATPAPTDGGGSR